MFNFLTDHIKDTENPQTYKQHFDVAFYNSAKLLWSGIQGMIHAIFPWIWPFKTSTQIIKSVKILIDTSRHKAEFRAIIPIGYLENRHLTDDNEN